ncbi:glycogen synthase GlgA [Profundibacterium mesophilum]|uniref:Glycogen synthase n=1 Tax=Profundibacterium mesophilum KAUST100406-0324 TaxID=1037889 RepID=A0A921TEP2_9RHOB|nr:glycogen synthase GlgA [Profundibacterium mesophilum]KAF0677506.1 Glycogen synthase [Profundibacterium mesophilum KAUST100406-0324]
MSRVLSVASECAPLIKTGGLGDVVGALPAALAPQGVEMKVLLPGYPAVLTGLEGVREVMREDDLAGGTGRVLAARRAGLDLLVLDAPHLFDRDGSPYLGPDGRDWPDNPERFAALSLVAARIGRMGVDGWHPDVLHCHDWQAGFAPLFMQRMEGGRPAGSVMTIHNMAFHGLAPQERIEALGLPRDDFNSDGYEFWGHVSALKAGLVHADRLTTVSPNYARELMTPEFGMGLDGVIRARRADLCGILNGIDTEAWDPAHDPHIARFRSGRGKSRAKRALLEEFGLAEGSGPLAIVVSRLTEQKGLDLLLEALPRFVELGGQLALLGSGNADLEERWREAARAHDGVGVVIGYDEALSHRMMAGADAILVPSRFEPCGLTQLYGLRYGTVPVVALTGGLADTVIHASPAALAAGAATGIQFWPAATDPLIGALEHLVALYGDDRTWSKIIRNAMRQPVGWNVSAQAYAELYREIGQS